MSSQIVKPYEDVQSRTSLYRNTRCSPLPPPPTPDQPEPASSPVRSRRTDSDAGRQSTYAFTLKGELRHSTNLVMARIGSEDVPRGLPCPDHLRCSGKGQKWSSFRALPWLPPRATKREKQDLYSSRASYYVQFIYCTCIAPAFLGTECRMAPTRVMLPAPQWLLDLQSSCDKAVSFHNRRTAYRSVTKAAWSQDCNLSAYPFLRQSQTTEQSMYICFLFPYRRCCRETLPSRIRAI